MLISLDRVRSGIIALIALLGVAGCSTAPIEVGEPVAPEFPADKVLIDDQETVGQVISDPWEGFNRTIYRFNYRFDKYIFLPVVNAYETVTPDVAEKGIHNFFNNIREIPTLFNSILQLNAKKTAETGARMIWNTTLGLLGFIDVASGMEIPRHQEDFGQTLGYWGAGTGPFLMLPILGPSNVRDGIGTGVDWYVSKTIWEGMTDLEAWQDSTLTGLKAIDERANISFRYYETGSPFEYEYIRWLFTTKRQMDIER